MKWMRPPNPRRRRRNWRAFWIMLALISITLFVLGAGIRELWLFLLILAWIGWWMRG